MSNFYNCHTLEELDEMHPCERHTMCGDLDLGCCSLCYGTGWWEPMFSNGEPCPNTEKEEKYIKNGERYKIPYLQIAEKLIIYIQIQLPPYIPVQPEDYLDYYIDQWDKRLEALGCHHNNSNFSQHINNICIWQPPRHMKD